MSKVNKSRKTWTEKGYKQGYKKSEAEHKITYSCSVCKGQLIMKPGENDHIAMKKMMSDAGWAHSSCHNAKKTR